MSESVWSANDTTPSAIEAALRELLVQHHHENPSYVPARVLNLVCIVDREWRGEIENRLERVGRYHPSRTILIAVDRRRTTLDARAVLTAPEDTTPGHFATTHEEVIVEVGPRHLPHLDTIIDPLVITDLATVVWSPHGHPDAVDACDRLAQVILLDSIDEPDIQDGLARSLELAEHHYVVDLAWLRSTPWRERIAATFDPPKWRRELATISQVCIRHHPDSAIAGLLFFGWLASRLGWKPEATLLSRSGTLVAHARAHRDDVALELLPAPEQSVRGLAGITITTGSGMKLTLGRGEGGLRATRVDRKGRSWDWTLLGASRGEAGILGEGIRQALLRDPTYRPALEAASAMVA